MATVKEAWINRSEVIDESAEITYYVIGAADEAAVKVACEADIPEVYDGLIKRHTRITARLSEDTWAVIAYFTKEPWTWPDARFAFDTSGGTQHITQAIETVNSYGPDADDGNKGAIGYDGKNVQGVDITVPVFKWSETHHFYDFQITDAYKKKLADLTGRVNGDTFKGFAAGEVLFLGASGSRLNDDSAAQWEVAFHFARSPNRTGIEVGDIGGIAKKGWEYMDIRYRDEPNAAGREEGEATPTGGVHSAKPQIFRVPRAVYIHRVSYDADFSELGIGI